MTSLRSSNVLRISAVFSCLALGSVALAQGPLPDAPSASVEPAPVIVMRNPRVMPRPRAEAPHKFWDNQNRALFAAVAVSSTADFFVTRANLQNGGQELNPLVRAFGRSTPGLALNFAGETAGVISLSYFFHKTNHHRLERIVSIVNVGASAGAVGYGLAHR
jgi:hypothetical protein